MMCGIIFAFLITQITPMKEFKILVVLLIIFLSGCASLMVVPYSQYSGENKAVLEVKTNTLNNFFLQTYAEAKDCTGRLRLDGVDGNVSSPYSLNYIEPNKPFVVTISGGDGNRLCVYSLSFIPEEAAKYELTVDLNPNDFCVSSLTKGDDAVQSKISDMPASGVVEQSPFCKGQVFVQVDGQRIETSAYRFDSWAEQSRLKRKDK